MSPVPARQPLDILSTAAALSVMALMVVLLVVATGDPADRNLVTTIAIGLGAAGLILFRQLRKNEGGLRMSEARAHYSATHDPVTGLPTKSLLLDRMADLPDGARVGVFCIGLDQFEELYDFLGHDVGDRVIAELSRRLATVCPETDTVARIADGVFALCWADLTPAKAEGVAGQLIRLLAAPCEAASKDTVIAASIGVAFWTAADGRPEEGLRRARLAMAVARKQGGNGWRAFDPVMDSELRERKALEADLRAALSGAPNAGSLTLSYQPQINARGVITGVEALMRWAHPVRGLISPTVFVPLAENCGLSEVVDRFALKQAFIDSRRWPTIRTAINISATQVQAGDLVGLLQGLLTETGASARALEIEITESVLLSDDPATYETLKAVRKMGFTLAIDDFGTGYSSLGYLKRFPIDKIKIDRSFVTHLGMQPESDAIVRAIVEMAEALDLKVLAEGVETRAQVDRLAIVGCGDIQGFYFSRPVEAEAIDRMLARDAKVA
ncbi:MAG: GGDEF domain-containing protein [Caulobacteraceae bacterium]|nr:GGDEF domain-containing protein [Caulobacteraceae bacterium]